MTLLDKCLKLFNIILTVDITKFLFVQPQCSRCHRPEHFTVSCPEKTSTVVRQEDAMVSHFLHDCDEEEPEFQKIFVNKVRKSWNI